MSRYDPLHHSRRAIAAKRAMFRIYGHTCHICGHPIDYTLPWTDPAAYVVDHIVPIAAGGSDAINNKQAAHRDCNRQKGAKPHADTIKRSGSLERPR